MRVLFNLNNYGYDVIITFRGGSLLPLPASAPELAVLKPELASDVLLALERGDTKLERIAAYSAQRWRELYALAHLVTYDQVSAPYTAFAPDPDLAVVSALHLSRRFRVLLELPALTPTQSALLAGSGVDVLLPNASSIDAADAVLVQPRASASRSLRDVGLLGGAWFRRVNPRAQSDWLVLDEYKAPPAGSLSLRRPENLLSFLDAMVVDVLREVALSPLPLRSLSELGFDEQVEELIVYGYIRVERDVLRATEKALFALAQARKLTGPPPFTPRVAPVRGGEEGEEEGGEGGE
ncbi:MAG: hypothetical protein QXV98_02900 [Thermofilaceae archaeon]